MKGSDIAGWIMTNNRLTNNLEFSFGPDLLLGRDSCFSGSRAVILGHFFDRVKSDGSFRIPVKLLLVDAEDLFKEVGIVFNGLVARGVDPAQFSLVFSFYINAINLVIFILTIPEETRGGKRVSDFGSHQLNTGKTT